MLSVYCGVLLAALGITAYVLCQALAGGWQAQVTQRHARVHGARGGAAGAHM